jgi:hypothetical protein
LCYQTGRYGAANSKVGQQGPILIASYLNVELVSDGYHVCGLSHSFKVLQFFAILERVQVGLLDQERDEIIIDEEKIELLAKGGIVCVEWLLTAVQQSMGGVEVVDHHRFVFRDSF